MPAGRRGGPIRGFPPLPGQPDPVYPHGPFSLWNRPSMRAAWLGLTHPVDGHAEADGEPGYSRLAVSDPSADATSTQTMPAIEDERGLGGWEPSPARRDWGSHAEGHIPAPVRTARDGTPRGGTAGRGAPGRGQPGGPQPGGPQPGGAQPGGGRRATRTPLPRPARRRGGTSRGRSNLMVAGLVLSPVLVVILVVAFYVYRSIRPAAPSAHTAPPANPTAAPSSPAPALGPWKHIQQRSQDPLPLSVTELFPARFSTGGLSGSRTITRATAKCTRTVIGSALQNAVHKAGCTQVLRASYLSADRKLMATIGVLNLSTASAAKQVGQSAGAREFIKQLPAAHGPTHRLGHGTGLEEAVVKGHYLILTWTEFANLHSPSGKKQIAKLRGFSAALIAGTANVSLSSRMVTGVPSRA